MKSISIKSLFRVSVIFLCCIPFIANAQLGKDGTKTITSAGVIVNEYTYLTIDAPAGATQINVNNSFLNNNSRFTFDCQAGDLLLIIQMQGASINGSLSGNVALPDDSTWGAVTNYNNCGNWELVEVKSRNSATRLTLDCALKNSYTVAGKTQIVRIPRHTDITVTNGGELTCEPWDGNAGGIAAIETQGNITIQAGGKIDVSGQGFRGGKLLENNSSSGISNFGSILTEYGAEKGESIAGFQADYDALGGRYGKGAPANGGGGGTAQNGGGGGGANAGNINTWIGYGNPDLSGSYSSAWNLEFPGRATLTSSGGGRGGYTYSANDQNALSVAPGNASWGGDNRRKQGGFGGRPLDYSTGRLFFGGGGGAGDQNNNEGGTGGNGGGLIYLLAYGNINGAGQVLANGADGEDADGVPAVAGYAGRDGAGGGGGGGTIVLNASNGVSGITASANGGKGGNQVISKGASYVGNVNEAEGPGGGGGGGYITLSSGSITQTATGGNNGITNSDALTEFLPNGATRGGSGSTGQSFSNFYITAPNDTVCSGNAITLNASFSGNTPTGATLYWYNVGSGGNPLGSGPTYTTPVLTAPPNLRIYFVGSCPGTYRQPVYVTVVPPFTVDAGSDISKCESETVQLSASGALTYNWLPVDGLNNPNIANPTSNVTTTTTYIVTGYFSDCFDTDEITVTVTPDVTPEVSIVVSQNNVCVNTSVTFTATPIYGGASPAYQWKVNGGNVGTNSNTFTTSSLNNGDIVTCVMTSNLAGCLSSPTATSNSIVMNISSPATASVIITASQNPVCAGTNVTFTATPTNGGASPTYQWKVNGANTGTNSNTFSTSSLNNGNEVLVEMSSNAACVTPVPAVSNTITMTVNPLITPSVSISASQTTICAGTNVTFTATPTSGGASPSYQWKINGNNAGINSNTFSSTTLSNGDVVTVEMTSNANCASPATVTSNQIAVTVNSLVTPSVSINASQTTICAGTNVTFTATPTSGGASPSYQWKINGNNAGSNANSFSTTTLNNGDAVTVVMTSNANCASPATATSNQITITVTSIVTPFVSITASQTTVCPGFSVDFTATVTNGGSSPSYQWKINGGNVGANSNLFSTASLNNGDVVTCEIISNANCANPLTATSNSITITVTTNVVPSVNITASQNPACAGTSVTFTAVPVNEGTAPVYQWKVNGTNAGTNSSTFSSSTLNDGDVVECEMTSNAACVNPATATSNSITIAVTSPVTPTVSIVESQNNICSGTSVTFTATPADGGTTPVYQWKVNGVNAGTNSPTFSSASLNNNDVITCEMTSNANCVSPATVTSNQITMTVLPSVAPTVSISASQTTVCPGFSVYFTATITGGGSSPSYQWKINSGNVGTNSNLFSTASLNNGDVVTCEIISNANCASPLTATSNSITITVTTNVVPLVSISASQNPVCAGASVTFTAVSVNEGTAPVYQWKVNGTNVGTNSPTFSSSTLNDGDVVECEMTSNAACVNPATATSNSITIAVTSPVTPSVAIVESQNNICSGTSVTFTATPADGGTTPVYQWKVNGVNAGTNSATFSSAAFNNNDVVTCEMTSNANCVTAATATSNAITMSVTPTVQPGIIISASQTNICAGAQVLFSSTITNGGSTPAYQWKINGANVGTNADSFATSNLNNGDLVTCVFTSNANCASPATVTSTGITITVSTNANPTISISASQTTICSGTSVTFTATAGNAGSSPAYQWKINGTNAGTNSASFITSALNNGDRIKCVLTANNPCSPVTTVESDSIVITVSPTFNPSVFINASQTVVCEGASAAFKAVPQNTGSNPAILWFIDDVSTGDDDDTYTSSTLQDGDKVIVRVTSSATCANPQVVYDTVTITVIPSPTANAGPDASVCKNDSVQLNGSGGANYSWLPASSLSNAGVSNPYAKPDTTTQYVLTVTAANGCTDKDTVVITVNTCNGIAVFQNGLVKVYPNPVTDLLMMEVAGIYGEIQYALFDLSGRQVNESVRYFSNGTEQSVIDMRHLSASMYLLKIVSKGEAVHFRIDKF
jgi:hypothetical protein